MKPFIDPAFWSDPDIEAQTPGVKLCALWLFTNSQTSLLGLCSASPGRFTFETKLPSSALDKTVEALPRAFLKFENTIFVRNYIRHQFGSGEKLVRNNFFVALKSLLLSVKNEKLRDAIASDYPEFLEALGKPSKGLTKPKDRKGKGSTGQERECEGKHPSAEDIYDAYPRKVKRPDAIRAIRKAMLAADSVHLLERTQAYAKTQPKNDRFTPHPATWFNAEQYDDDPETWKPRHNNGQHPEQTQDEKYAYKAKKLDEQDEADRRYKEFQKQELERQKQAERK